MARIYLETTTLSFYHNARVEPEMVAGQNWTRRWLDAAVNGSDELVTSLAVEAELRGGEFPNKDQMLALVSQFSLVDLNEAVAEAVDGYTAHRVMPNNPSGDALHLAAASFHRCDFLPGRLDFMADALEGGAYLLLDNPFDLLEALVVHRTTSVGLTILNSLPGSEWDASLST